MPRSWTSHEGAFAYLSADDADSHGVAVIVTTGSESSKPDLGYASTGEAVSPEARRAVAEALGLEAESLVFMEQVHGAGIAVVGRDDAGRGLGRRETTVAGADAMVTSSSQIALVGLSADCPLVALWDTGSDLLAIAHAGWRSLAGEILKRLVERMVGRGASAAGLRAAVGPSIGACCYEVGDDVVEALVGSGIARRDHLSRVGDRTHLDLAGVVQHQLQQAGLGAASITAHPLCTMCRGDLFHSYRREGPGAGRQAMAIRRKG